MYFAVTSAALLVLGVAEATLRHVRPRSDPYAAEKLQPQSANPYLPRPAEPNVRARIDAVGIPGLPAAGRHTTNALGFRSPEIGHERVAGRCRIFLLGGSAMECRELDDALTVRAQLEKALNGGGRQSFEIAFAGAWAARSFDYVGLLAHRVLHLSGDLVILAPGAGDMFEAMQGRDYLFPPPDVARARKHSSRHLVKMLMTQTQLGRVAHDLVWRRRPIDAIHIDPRSESQWFYRGAPRRAPNAPPRVDLEPYRDNLVSAIGMARAHGVPLILCTQASRLAQPRPELGDDPWFWAGQVAHRRGDVAVALARYNDVTRDVARAQGVPLCDLDAELSDKSGVFYDEFHYTAHGAELTGAALARAVRASGQATSADPRRA